MRRAHVDALAMELPDCTRQETGEQRLLAAVLHQALHDAAKGHADAVAWLGSDAPVELGFSYLDVCQVLGVDPSWARSQVRERVRPVGRGAVDRPRRLRAA